MVSKLFRFFDMVFYKYLVAGGWSFYGRMVMKKGCITTVWVVLIVFFACSTSMAMCEGDIDNDRDIDGRDLAAFAVDVNHIYRFSVQEFAEHFSRTDCPLSIPLNLFNIGDSIGEGEAADGTIGEAHHESVWSTGYDFSDGVYSFNEQYENADAQRYDENSADTDDMFNRAESGAVMDKFALQAAEVVTEAGKTFSGRAGMISFLLGSNDVCAEDLSSMTDPVDFEAQFRAGLDVLSQAASTKYAHIHVSSIPAIYWLWNAKRTNVWCALFVWPFVPCKNLLKNAFNDCGDNDSHLDPDTIHGDDGPDCRRRKQFHAAIRDIYNPILKNVLGEYKDDGRLPNAYFVDIFDIRFYDRHVNNGDCFHPSFEGHKLLADEHWCRSLWGDDDTWCLP
jgi:lysophospholipase L1-like esterase